MSQFEERITADEVFAGFDDEESVASPYMQNRELSWLSFNERVLDLGADDSIPLLERLNFISIFSSNLQEFFMVRVGSLTDLLAVSPPVTDSKTNMTVKQQLRAIHERCHELYPIEESIYEHVRGLLAKQGIRHLRPNDLTSEQQDYLFDLLRKGIEPVLSPQIVNSRHPFPHLENGKLYIVVRLDDEKASAERKKAKKERDKAKASKDKGAEGVLLGLIPLPHQCERVIKLPGPGCPFILLEHVIEMFASHIFSMYKVKHTNVICVTRNADLDASQGIDELDEDYREHMRRLLKKRDRLAPVRLECERPLSPVLQSLLLKRLRLKPYQVYNTRVPLDLSFVANMGALIDPQKLEDLKYKPFDPAWPVCFDRSRRIIDQVVERDTLLFYPYESMDPFVMLLREAALDPYVISIKITLYRLARQSHLAEALISAAEMGKEVTTLFELRARFDESNNIDWSHRFEEAGCNVIYGFRDFKVHSKICCITRRLPDGSLQHITQLGTGNYNEKTARLYTDLSFITTSDAFAHDAHEFFRNMQLENISDSYQVLRVAPLQIKSLIMRELDGQIERAVRGLPCGAFLKTNAITDKEVIEKIAAASRAGVPVTLLARGICCLVPHVAGDTDNVRVVSLIGRLLEHSRIYCFGADEDQTVYLSSADLMTRNLNKRIEIAWPVLDAELKRRILVYNSICMHDTAKLREMRPDETYTPLGTLTSLDDSGNPRPAYDSQAALIEQAALAAETVAQSTQPAAVAPATQSAADAGNASELHVQPAAYSIYDEPASVDDLTRPSGIVETGVADVALPKSLDEALQAEALEQAEAQTSNAPEPVVASPESQPVQEQPRATATSAEEGEAKQVAETPVAAATPADKLVAEERFAVEGIEPSKEQAEATQPAAAQGQPSAQQSAQEQQEPLREPSSTEQHVSTQASPMPMQPSPMQEQPMMVQEQTEAMQETVQPYPLYQQDLTPTVIPQPVPTVNASNTVVPFIPADEARRMQGPSLDELLFAPTERPTQAAKLQELSIEDIVPREADAEMASRQAAESGFFSRQNEGIVMPPKKRRFFHRNK